MLCKTNKLKKMPRSCLYLYRYVLARWNSASRKTNNLSLCTNRWLIPTHLTLIVALITDWLLLFHSQLTPSSPLPNWSYCSIYLWGKDAPCWLLRLKLQLRTLLLLPTRHSVLSLIGGVDIKRTCQNVFYSKTVRTKLWESTIRQTFIVWWA